MKRIYRFWVRGGLLPEAIKLTFSSEILPDSTDVFFDDIIIKKDGSVVVWDNGLQIVKKETSRNWYCFFNVDLAFVFTQVKSIQGYPLHFSMENKV
jgi:hypothetical protein